MIQDKPTQHVASEQLSQAAVHPTTAGLESCSTKTAFADSGEATNSAIKYPVTVGYRVTAPNIIATRDISYVLQCVRTGIVEGTDNRAIIHTIRNTPNEKMAKAMKADLPYFMGSVCKRYRSNESVEYAHFAIIDLDHVPDIEGTKKLALARLPFVSYALQSVRDGVKLIAQFDKPITDQKQYRLLWAYLALLVKRELQLPVDSTPDWSRACFFSYDPDLLINSHYQPLNVEIAIQEAELLLELSERREHRLQQSSATETHPEVQARTSLNSRDGVDDFEKARSVVSQLTRMQMPYSEWIKVGHAIYAGFGERGKELWDMFQANPHYEDTEAELAKHWRSFARVHTITLATLFYMGEKYGIA